MAAEIVRLERTGVCGCGELVSAGQRPAYAASHEDVVCPACLADLSSEKAHQLSSPARTNGRPATGSGDAPGAASATSPRAVGSPDAAGAVLPRQWTADAATLTATLSALLRVPVSEPVPSAPTAPTADAAPLVAPAVVGTALVLAVPPAEQAPKAASDVAVEPCSPVVGPSEPSPVQACATPAVEDEPVATTRRSRHEADTVADERMPAQAHRRRAGLFTRLLTVRSLRMQAGQGKSGGKPDAAVGALLDAAAARGVLSLHDRRIPGRRSRIEHIAVGASGIYVIDVKHFKNASIELRPSQSTPASADLVVGGRVMTAAVAANRARVAELRSILDEVGLDDVPVSGALCFVDGLLPLSVGDLEVSGVHVMRPSGLTALVAAGGAIDVDDREKLQQFLAHHLPACA